MVFTTIDPTLTPTASMGYQNIGPGNLLDNGGFEIWQRGTSFSNLTTGTFSADRWKILVNGSPSYTITQSTSTVYSGLYSLKINVTSVGTGTYMAMVQQVENYQAYIGKTIVLSIAVWSNVSNTQVGLYDGTNNLNVNSASHPGDSSWHVLTVSGTVSSSANQLAVYLYEANANSGSAPLVGSVYFDAAMLIVGSTAVSFIPLHPQIDLARCQRYYELSSGVGNTGCSPIPGFNNSNIFDVIHTYKVTKHTAPTVTISSVTASVSQICTVNISSAPVADDANWTSTSVVNSQIDSADIRFQRNSATTTWGVIRWGYTWTASADI